MLKKGIVMFEIKKVMQMLDYQKAALNAVREYAAEKETEHCSYVEQICKPFNVDVSTVIPP